MKTNILYGLLLIGALSVSSCATQMAVSTQKIEDDVYYTKAKAGDVPDAPPPTFRQDVYADNTNTQPNDAQYYDSYGNDDGDYYYYDSYASRIDRFSYASPFGFYDDYYYGYSPYSAYGYGGYGYSGFGFGVGYGYGGYYGYSAFGIGYGGGYPYWGIYSAYGRSGYGGYGYGGGYGGIAANRARPFRGSGAPALAVGNRAVRAAGYNGNYPGLNTYPGRPVVNTYGRRSTTYGYPGNGAGNTYNNGNGGRETRAVRTDNPNYQQPTRATNSFPTGNSSSGGGGGTSSGGGRPARP